MSDQEIMALIQSLRNDREFKKMLEDPEVMKAVNAGDVAALMANPQFMKLLNNSSVREIERKSEVTDRRSIEVRHTAHAALPVTANPVDRHPLYRYYLPKIQKGQVWP